VYSDSVRQKYRKVARVVCFALAWGGLATWLYHFHVYYQYDATSPHKQDIASGRIYPQNNHGRVVYLTKDENARPMELSAISLGLVIGGFLFYGFFVDRSIFRPKSAKPWEIRRF